MLIPRRATVRPRATCPEMGDSLPLDELVAAAIEHRKTGAIEILGGAGSGKTSALEHLAATLSPGKPIIYLDEPAAIDVGSVKSMRLVVFSTAGWQPSGAADESFKLSLWQNDEWLEYLMAVHPTTCGSVIARLRDHADGGLLAGNAGLWRLVLDEMALNETATEIEQILLSASEAAISDASMYATAQEFALATLRGMTDTAIERRSELESMGAGTSAIRLLRHVAVQRIIAADRLATSLDVGDVCSLTWLPRELIRPVAKRARLSATAMASLHTMLSDEQAGLQSTAASILHATGTGWKPESGKAPSLAHAQLPGAQWPAINLSGATLTAANLSQADLRNANLSGANASGCHLSGANLERVDLTGSQLGVSNFCRACLDSAILRSADLRGANLTLASLRDACLSSADLRGARIDGADFSLANLMFATLNNLRLRDATFTGAVFTRASLVECDMEGIRLAKADLEGANLEGALLTGSVIRWGNFHGASLRRAGLADVDWEGADLSHADLSRCSFYLGSSRSGLVGSPIACEGSRTGFYTDDFDDQTYKAPEEIRKANLRGVNLRGAKIEGVDFYLVDLREAKYTPDQEEQLRSSGAILYERAGR